MSSLHDIVNNPELAYSFSQFLRKKFAEELFSFYLEIHEYRKILNPEERKARALVIYDFYLKEGAPKEVEVEPIMRKLISRSLPNPPQKIFDAVQATAARNLSSLVSEYFRDPALNQNRTKQRVENREEIIKRNEYLKKLLRIQDVVLIFSPDKEIGTSNSLSDRGQLLLAAEKMVGVKWMITAGEEISTFIGVIVNMNKLEITPDMIFSFIEYLHEMASKKIGLESGIICDSIWDGITTFLTAWVSIFFRKPYKLWNLRLNRSERTKLIERLCNFLLKFQLAGGTSRINRIKLAILKAASVSPKGSVPRFRKKWIIPHDSLGLLSLKNMDIEWIEKKEDYNHQHKRSSSYGASPLPSPIISPIMSPTTSPIQSPSTSPRTSPRESTSISSSSSGSFIKFKTSDSRKTKRDLNFSFGRRSSSDVTDSSKLLKSDSMLRLSSVSPLAILPSVNKLAREMAKLDAKQFNKIMPQELISMNWEGLNLDVTRCPNVYANMQLFNALSSYFTQMILSQEEQNHRLIIIEYLIQLGNVSLQLRNYNGLMAVLAGVQHHSVQRLRGDWEFVKSKFLSQLAMLEYVMDCKDNYCNYRERVRNEEMNGKCIIPFLGVVLRDMTFIDQGNNDVTEDGLVNFEKIRLQGLVVQSVLRNQFRSSQLHGKSIEARFFLNNAYAQMNCWKDNAEGLSTHLWNLSCKLCRPTPAMQVSTDVEDHPVVDRTERTPEFSSFTITTSTGSTASEFEDNADMQIS